MLFKFFKKRQKKVGNGIDSPSGLGKFPNFYYGLFFNPSLRTFKNPNDNSYDIYQLAVLILELC